MTHDDTDDASQSRDRGGDAVPVRPGRQVDTPPNKADDAPAEALEQPEQYATPRISEDALQNPLIVQQLAAYFQQNHVHLPVLTPEPETMRVMKQETPELYKAYVDAINAEVKSSFIQQTYPYTEPLENVKSGRRYGLIVTALVLLLAGYALYLGHPTAATIIIGIDLIGLVALFTNTSNSGAVEADKQE